MARLSYVVRALLLSALVAAVLAAEKTKSVKLAKTAKTVKAENGTKIEKPADVKENKKRDANADTSDMAVEETEYPGYHPVLAAYDSGSAARHSDEDLSIGSYSVYTGYEGSEETGYNEEYSPEYSLEIYEAAEVSVYDVYRASYGSYEQAPPLPPPEYAPPPPPPQYAPPPPPQMFGPAPPPDTCGRYTGPPCQRSRYRTFDGSCNNLYFPDWGMAGTNYGRLLPPIYSDNIQAIPVSRSGRPLPNAREVSFVMFPELEIPDPKWTLSAMQWGQFMTHDMGLIQGTSQHKGHPTECCSDQGQLLPEAYSNPSCFPIIIPPNDPVYAYEGIQCRNFVRSVTDIDRGCASYKPADQSNTVSHFLDLSLVYGSDDQTAAGLRAFVGGRLAVDVRYNREVLPAAQNKSSTCDIQSENEVCYRAGDVRVNQNPQLTVIHTIMLREHNRIANQLAYLNPHWSDETIYQEARRINTAINQQISYYEWLPIFIGQENSIRRKILFETDGWVNDYDPYVNPSVLNEHSNAASRYFHSVIASHLLLVDEPRYSYGYNSLRLSDHFNRPGVIEDYDNFDKLSRGLCFQPQEKSDPWFNREITNFLFRGPNKLGHDLRAIDIHRNRDHGLNTYNEYRTLAGLPKAYSWNDLEAQIEPEHIEKLSRLYETPDDVDLTVGGSVERHVEDTLIGPTMLNILSEQFWRTRAGDRYWYETGDPEIGFTLEQLHEIRKASMSRLLCDNGDYIQVMQPRGFEQVSPDNPLVNCAELPAIDLSLWKDIGGGGYPAYK